MTDKQTSDLARNARETREASAGWMLQRIARQIENQMKQRLKEVFAPAPLKIDDFIVLMTLAEREGCNQTELGAGMRLKAYTVSRTLDRLEELGLVARHQDSQSKRSFRLFLTEAGQGLMTQVLDMVVAQNAAFLAPLDPSDRAEFLRLLRLLTAVSRDDPAQA